MVRPDEEKARRRELEAAPGEDGGRSVQRVQEATGSPAERTPRESYTVTHGHGRRGRGGVSQRARLDWFATRKMLNGRERHVVAGSPHLGFIIWRFKQSKAAANIAGYYSEFGLAQHWPNRLCLEPVLVQKYRVSRFRPGKPK